MNELKLLRHEMKRNQKTRKIWILLLDKLLMFHFFISFLGRWNSPYFSRQGRPFRGGEDFAQQICRCRGCRCGKFSQCMLNHSDTNAFAFSFKSFAVLKSLWTLQIMPILLLVSSLWNKRKEHLFIETFHFNLPGIWKTSLCDFYRMCLLSVSVSHKLASCCLIVIKRSIRVKLLRLAVTRDCDAISLTIVSCRSLSSIVFQRESLQRSVCNCYVCL